MIFPWSISVPTHQLLVYAINKNAEALLVSSQEIGIDVNDEKTKYMFISREKNAGQNHNIKICNKSFERLERVKYLGTTLINQNSIKSRLKSGNSCYF
jgi:hypothetical protein